jgi:pimeloyl-ACP methyl ester carboxylesterase
MAGTFGFALAPGDDTPLYYSVTPPQSGSTSGRNLVLSDGIGCDGFIWKYLRRSLGGDHRIVHWNYRGHGRTPMPRDRSRVRISDLARDMIAVLDDSATERAVLFGHSMGVQVVLETYKQFPERVEGLVLVCGAPGRPLATFRGTDLAARLLPHLHGAIQRVPGLFNGAWRLLVKPSQLAHAVAEKLEVNPRLLERSDLEPYLHGLNKVPVTLFFDMLSHAQQHDARELLPSIAVPTMIIAGARDGFTPARLSQAMHEQIAKSELLLLEDCSHIAPLERPSQVDASVRDFLSRRF